jgi:hypothetical protein
MSLPDVPGGGPALPAYTRLNFLEAYAPERDADTVKAQSIKSIVMIVLFPIIFALLVGYHATREETFTVQLANPTYDYYSSYFETHAPVCKCANPGITVANATTLYMPAEGDITVTACARVVQVRACARARAR